MGKFEDIDSLFRSFYRPLCLYASRFMLDSEAVEDLVQDVFIAYWNRLQDGMPVPSSPKSYLYRSVHNKCLDTLRKTDASRIEGVGYDVVDEEAEDRSFIWAKLWTAIDKLPEKRREILLMNKRDGMTYSEIASQLGISENTVHAHIAKALKTLREGAKKIFLFFFA